MAQIRLIILDRDGVINQDSDDYIKSVAEWMPLPGSVEAIAKLKQAGFQVAIATNQSGIARGYYSLATLDAMHQKLADLLAPYQAAIDYIAYCPHLDEDQCACRKPKPGLLSAILQHFAYDSTQALMVGDSVSDWQAASVLNIPYAQVRTGKGARTLASGKLPKAVAVYEDLADFTAQFLKDSR